MSLGIAIVFVSYFMQKGTPKLCELSEYMFYKEWNRLKAGLNLREELKNIDSYFRAANYLSVGQLYLLNNPLRPFLPFSSDVVAVFFPVIASSN